MGARSDLRARVLATTIGLIVAVVLPVGGPLSAPPGTTPAALPPLRGFAFRSIESKVLPGSSGEKAPGHGCSGAIKDVDRLGRLAVVSVFHQNGCYTGVTYSHADFRVERGEFAAVGAAPERPAPSITIKTRGVLEGYRLHEPARKASRFLGSHHVVFFAFARAVDHSVYLFSGGAVSKLADISAARIVPGGLTKIGELDASMVSGSVVVIFAPADARLSAYTELSPEVEAARLLETSLGRIGVYRLRVSGVPFDTALDFTAAPDSYGNMYGRTKAYFPALDRSGAPGVIWQDRKTSTIHATWLGDLIHPRTVTLLRSRDRLAAATSDGKGTLYLLTVEEATKGALTARRVTVVRTDTAGVLQARSTPDAGPHGLNIVSFSPSDVASLAVSGERLGLVIGRTMHKSPDGLNHQGAIAVILDARSLAVVRNLGQTSGHSFDNELSVDSSGDFLALDLGDNYPRGVHLHRFSEKTRSSRVVLSYKTAHGTGPRSPAGRTYPLYAEISRAGRSFYKWSNDTATYSELGGLVAGQRGYSVVFAAEFSPEGRLLDSARTGARLNDARNIGLVQVVPDFDKRQRWGSVVPDEAVLTSAPSESGGFFSFGGAWTPQRNAGVMRLTDYADKTEANVSRLKVAPRPDGSLLLLWEKWGGAYKETMAMKVSEGGRILAGPVSLGSQVRLGRTDEPLARADGVFLFSGDRADGRIVVTWIQD